uniref:Uncharacterized protein n=1 Tax=Lepeophtheirus salmonis TaxID=72036 RepID=A0A0K2TA62_LEPSM
MYEEGLKSFRLNLKMTVLVVRLLFLLYTGRGDNMSIMSD